MLEFPNCCIPQISCPNKEWFKPIELNCLHKKQEYETNIQPSNSTTITKHKRGNYDREKNKKTQDIKCISDFPFHQHMYQPMYYENFVLGCQNIIG